MTHQLELSELQRDWVADAAMAFPGFFTRSQRFTTDDLHPLLPKPENHNWFGVLMAKLKNQGRIKRVSAVASTRPEANGRLLSLWEVVL